MATTPDTEFSLAQRIKRNNNGLTPIKRKFPKRACTFPVGLLSIDDTVLATLDLDHEDPTDTGTNLMPDGSDTRSQDNYENNDNYSRSNTAEISAVDSAAVERDEEMDLFEDDLSAFELSAVCKTTQVRRELDKVFNNTASPTERIDDTAVNELEIEDIEWQDDTLLDRALSDIELLEKEEIVPDGFEDVQFSLLNRIDKVSPDGKSNDLNSSASIHPVAKIPDGETQEPRAQTSNIPYKDTPEEDPQISTSNHPVSRLADEETPKNSRISTSSDPVAIILNENIPSCSKKSGSPLTAIKKKFPSPDGCVANKKSREDNENAKQSVFAMPNTHGRKSNTFTERGSFYGLPTRIKTLIQQMKGITDLYLWQDECLNLKAVKDRRNLVYALPTSGGKTLVAEILMLREIVCYKKNAIFILPFVAIVQEKVRSLAPFALELNFLVEEYAAGKGTYPPRKRRRKNSIYICTIEKGLSLINSLIEEGRLNEVGFVVVDELHLLGENGGRGATLEGLLTKIMYSKANIHIVGMSATIGNLNEVADFLNADVYTQNFRPVELKEYVKCEDDIWLIDLKEPEILTDLKKIKYSYSEEATRLDPDRLGGLVMDVIPKDSCLVFCPSRKNCENVALLLTKVLFSSLQEHKKEEKNILLRALEIEGGTPCPVLSKTVKFGIAYHHSGLMADERKLLEEAFRAGTLCVICCTSTLAAGVNLPARRVLLRHPYIGNQFLNLSRYKQMIGRAGRAGLGEVGESILICKTNEIPKVKELLTSSMDDSLSTMHIEEDRGIKNLVLSSILLGLATTRFELHRLTAMTLLGIQQERLDVSVKKITDQTIKALMKSGAIKVKQSTTYSDVKPNLTVLIPSQQTPHKVKTPPPKGKKTVILAYGTKLEVCQLGRAAMKGSVDLDRAHTLYTDLKTAQRQLVLLDSLHLLYLVTPYDLVDQIKPVGTIYYDVVSTLSPIQMETARVLGIDEGSINKLRAGMMPKSVEARVVNRFYLTLMLYDLWNKQTVHVVAEKYQVNRGVVQHLLSASASFASCVVRFCQELNEFWVFRDLLTTFCQKLSHCCSAELEPLMELPTVKVGRARQLFNAGFKTLSSIAIADPTDICEKIEHMPRKTATQIIAAAKLMLLEKVENLRDEAEEVLEGLDFNHSFRNA